MERLNARNSEAFTLLHGAGHTFGKRLTQTQLESLVEDNEHEDEDLPTILPRGLPTDLTFAYEEFAIERKQSLTCPRGLKDEDARLLPFVPVRTASDNDNLHNLPDSTKKEANRHLIILVDATEEQKQMNILKTQEMMKKAEDFKKTNPKPELIKQGVHHDLEPQPVEEPPKPEEQKDPLKPPPKPNETLDKLEKELKKVETALRKKAPPPKTMKEQKKASSEESDETSSNESSSDEEIMMPRTGGIMPGMGGMMPGMGGMMPGMGGMMPGMGGMMPGMGGMMPGMGGMMPGMGGMMPGMGGMMPWMGGMMPGMGGMMQGIGGYDTGYYPTTNYPNPYPGRPPRGPAGKGQGDTRCKDSQAKKICKPKTPKFVKKNQGLNFDFLPHDNCCTEVELIIEPDEPDPLECAINNGIMPIVCCYMPPCLSLDPKSPLGASVANNGSGNNSHYAHSQSQKGSGQNKLGSISGGPIRQTLIGGASPTKQSNSVNNIVSENDIGEVFHSLEDIDEVNLDEDNAVPAWASQHRQSNPESYHSNGSSHYSPKANISNHNSPGSYHSHHSSNGSNHSDRGKHKSLRHSTQPSNRSNNSHAGSND